MHSPTILLVEDEKNIRNFMKAILQVEHMNVLEARTGSEALTMANSHIPDLILLDLGLPDMDGKEVLVAIREWSIAPIVVVSARQDEEEKVEALECGADDYITKPFGNKEFVARVRTALRRHTMENLDADSYNDGFYVHEMTIDYKKRILKISDEVVKLTPTEYKIVVLLSKYAGRVLTHSHIMREVWGPYGADRQSLRVNMANIRRKIEKNPADPMYILTEVGVGYRMSDPSDE